ncbi:hypothetical protein DL96DRAFT_1820962 [Flagelloscypha sp. PMI_526]|nr:hypothetical protein DL96DRAFT_1820962 [Flagelloscypha sp. PMI_526]
MPTPKEGTLQQPDLEALSHPYQSRESWVSEYLIPLLWILLYLTGFGGYNVAAGALGRFMLDHFHLWNQTIPSNTAGIDKHGELIAALVAGCLAPPMTVWIMVILILVDDQLRKRDVKFQFGDDAGFRAVVWISVFANWVGIIMTGAMFHPRFQHVKVASMLAIYGFGNLLLLPTLRLLVGMTLGSLRLWNDWGRR